MNIKSVTGMIGLVALLAFLLPPMIKLHKIALIVVILIGAGMAIYEYVETLRNKDD